MGCTKCSVQCSTVKGVCLDADNGADDVKAMLDNCSVLADCVDKLHCVAVEVAEVVRDGITDCNRISMRTSMGSLLS